VIYLGGDVGGAYKTEDHGKHWRFINRGLVDYAVYALAVDRSNPDTVYAGTVGGICKSTDAGERWSFLAATAKAKLDLSVERGSSVRPIAVDPTNGDVVYAGSRHGKLFRSEDGGQTWRKLDYLQAFAGQPRPTPPPAFRGQGCLVLSYSSETGDWSKNGRAEKGFNEPGADWSAFRKITARFFVPKGAPKLQAQLVIQSGPSWLWQQGPFVDASPGEWTAATLDLAGLKDLESVHFAYVVVRSPEAGYKGEVYLDAVALHTGAGGEVAQGEAADQPGVILLGDWEKPGDPEGWRANRKIQDALFVTERRQSADLELKEKGVLSSVAVSERDPRLLFVTSTEFGLLRSEDGGATWAQLATPKSVSCVTVAPTDESVVYVACGQEGIWRSADKGGTWTVANAGIKEGCSLREVTVDPNDPNTAYCLGALGWEGYFYRSTDGGRTWQESRTLKRDFDANPTCPEDYGGRAEGTCPLSRPTNLAVSPLNPQELFVAGNWRNAFSADGGRTWEERDRGADITCVTDIRFLDQRTYVTSMDEGLAVSEDDGANWRQLLPLRYDTAISGHHWRVAVQSSGAAQRILTTCSPWAEPPNRVFVSEDGGKTFRMGRAGLPDYRPTPNTMWGESHPRALAVDPRDPQVLYLGMDGDPEPTKGRAGGGLFKSTDGGYTWAQLSNQPGSRRCFNALAVDPTDPNRLYWGACGAGGGLYRSDDAGQTWTHVFRHESWVFNVAVSPTGVVYCPGTNLWSSTDRGATWKKLTKFADSLVTVGLEIDPRDERALWISRVTWGTAAVGGVYKTTDAGTTWQEITGDLPYCKPTVLRLNPTTGELWAGGVGLFRLKQ
jgi:photosystem II stability/assembly factor-like uncharacterized protein